jgi:hypothetical protein
MIPFKTDGRPLGSHGPRHWWLAAMVVVAVASSCAITVDTQNDAGADAGESDAGDEVVDCESLDRDECAVTDACESALGTSPEAFCANDRTEYIYVGCQQRRSGCNDAITCVVAPSGERVYFPDSCVPNNLERCFADC